MVAGKDAGKSWPVRCGARTRYVRSRDWRDKAKVPDFVGKLFSSSRRFCTQVIT